METELQEYFNIIQDKSKTINPSARLRVEEYLFEFQIHYNHIVSLLWSKSGKTYTESFINYLFNQATEEIILALIMSNQAMDDFISDVKQVYGAIVTIKPEQLDDFIIATVVTSAVNEALAYTAEWASLLRMMELKFNKPLSSFLETYKTLQKS